MKVLVYSVKPFELPLLNNANRNSHALSFTSKRLSLETAPLANGFDVISIFSADDASEKVLKVLYEQGVRYLTLRSAGHDNLAKDMAAKLGMRAANVPSYSPNAIAEHAIALLMTFNRKIIQAQRQTLQQNFLLDHLIGFDLCSKTVGILGTGKIGRVLARILHGFGCNILANDLTENEEIVRDYGVTYASNDRICKSAEVIFICLPLTKKTNRFVDAAYIKHLERKPILVNIGRGSIVDTAAVLDGLDQDQVAGYLTDVYENEHGVFFYDQSRNELHDPLLHRLLCHPKVLLTPHQGFATQQALQKIAETTLANVEAWSRGSKAANEIV